MHLSLAIWRRHECAFAAVLTCNTEFLIFRKPGTPNTLSTGRNPFDFFFSLQRMVFRFFTTDAGIPH
jgi:hypothetical protein